MMRICAAALGLVLALTPFVSRALEKPMHPGELAHALDRVANTGRVLYVAAHPDDENTRLLAYLASARHVRAAYLSMTRGGGGQNLIGTEQGELLDVIRTEELLAARGLDGAEQRFSRMRDFGFSKSAAETFAIWDHEKALADVVRVIRTFQPDVVVTRFDENPPNHGHHTASAILAREAFAAAADPKRFPEQGLAPWQALRLVHNVSTWRGPPPPGALPLDVGAYDVRLGLGYGELAARSRSQHKSQGFGVPGERGTLLEHFTPVAGSAPQKDILEGVEVSWKRFGAKGARVDAALEKARGLLGRDRPEAAVPALLEARAAMAGLPDEPRVRDARADLEALSAEAAGVFLRATAPAPSAVPGAAVEVQLEAVARLGGVKLQRVTFAGDGVETPAKALGRNERALVTHTVHLPAEAQPSAPYWLARPAERGSYTVADPSLVGAPRGPAALEVVAELDIGGTPLRLRTPVVHAWTDRVHGERIRPFLVVPPATVTPVREAALPTNGKPAPVLLRVRAGAPVRGAVSLGLPAGWTSTPATQPVELAKAGDETTVRFAVEAPAGAKAIDVRPSITVDGKAWSWREDVIDYPHIPLQVVLQPATLRLSPLTVALPEGLVGYIHGSGDSIPDDLAHVGAHVELLDDETLRSGDLDRYATIVVGIRAYNTRPAVRAAHQRLMDYVERGGTVVVQYVTVSPWEPLSTPIGPYPIEIGRDRITNETAEMIAVQADSPLLRAPNRITSADFDGWVQERGLYFATKWDARYQPLLRAADPGEEPLTGGTLVAKHGKGRYVYTGLSFFRQLRAGVPGAYRLFVNLIAGK